MLAAPSLARHVSIRALTSVPPRAIAILDQAPKSSPPSSRPPSQTELALENTHGLGDFQADDE
jgi:hypothetical protein